MADVKAAVKLTVACSVGLCSSLYAGNNLKLSIGHADPLHERCIPSPYQDLLFSGLLLTMIKARNRASIQLRKAGLNSRPRD